MGETLVLSIGKLSAEQATYYLDQAEGRVDVVESVGGGVEDYYAAGGEARGDWLRQIRHPGRPCGPPPR